MTYRDWLKTQIKYHINQLEQAKKLYDKNSYSVISEYSKIYAFEEALIEYDRSEN